jgi:DNA-binding transcriptional MerR regulator
MTPTPTLPDTEYWTVREAAQYLGVDPQQLRAMRSRGTAPEAISDGFRLYFRREDIEKLRLRRQTRPIRRPYTQLVVPA